MFGKRGEGGGGGGWGGEGADCLILTQRALRHAISPNYEERRGGGEITQKIKSCLWKIWSTSQHTQTFPTSTFLRYAVISYGWPSPSPSVRLLSPLHSAFQAPPAPRPHQSTSQSGLVSDPQPLPPQNPLPKPTVHTWQSLGNSLKEQHYTTNCSLP